MCHCSASSPDAANSYLQNLRSKTRACPLTSRQLLDLARGQAIDFAYAQDGNGAAVSECGSSSGDNPVAGQRHVEARRSGDVRDKGDDRNSVL